ncbi:hypothetical protein ACHAXS_013082 [Conticribra weissflogii]
MSSIKERILHKPDPKAPPHIPLFLPQLSITKTNVMDHHPSHPNNDGNNEEKHEQREIRPLHPRDDVPRVMDFPNMPDPPPKDATVMHCEAAGGDDGEAGHGDDDAGIVFPKRCAKLSGGYIFITRLEGRDRDDGNRSKAAGGGGDAAKSAKGGERAAGEETDGVHPEGKTYCIPLAGSTVEFPPGGRRVFREHAHTGARAGYEMAIHVKFLDTTGETPVLATSAAVGGGRGAAGGQGKVKCFVVFDSLKLRETWSNAIKARCDVGNKPTTLRAAGSRFDGKSGKGEGLDVMGGGVSGSGVMSGILSKTAGKNKPKKNWAKIKGMVSLQAAFKKEEEMPTFGDPDLDAAVKVFGKAKFKEDDYVHKFLIKNKVDDLSSECDQLEKWMDVIKDGLRGAVLEQYEYFVEASREMSTMGREVAWLRTLVERQQETLMTMKNIDFGAGLEEIEEGRGLDDEGFGYISDEDGLLGAMAADDGSDASSVVSTSSEESGSNASASKTPIKTNRKRDARKRSLKTPFTTLPPTVEDETQGSPGRAGGTHPEGSNYIEIPAWIMDVTEEVSAFIKESRYTDATDLILKAKAEVADLLAMHEQPPVVSAPTPLRHNNNNTSNNKDRKNDAKNETNPAVASGPSTPKKLHKKHQAILQRTIIQLDGLIDRMSKRLAENLRRKNEALKASAKRERSDPLSALAPLASPVCLNDDAVALNLLVKLGKNQEAATAYAARRSLLLSECLYERPISSPVGMDAVIYAAQLSSSFFSSLALAVDGFLDLFIDADTGKGADDDTLNSRSIFMGNGDKRVPSGALSAVVLWCDSELAKFANVFGSSRLLGGLSLSPFNLRRQEDKPEDKSFEVAAKCVDQAFLFASENLDSIGLPLTPKLAELIRLKGCEGEIAAFMDPRWRALTFEWTLQNGDRRSSGRVVARRAIPAAGDDRRV